MTIVNGLGPVCPKHFLPVPRYWGGQVAAAGHERERAPRGEEGWKRQRGTCALWIRNVLPSGTEYRIYQRSGHVPLKGYYCTSALHNNEQNCFVLIGAV